MRLGVAVMYWPWLTFEEQLAIAVLADELGFDSVWASEAWGQEAVATLAFIAARTEQIALGAAILQMPARKPTTTAMAATTIDVMSGGRMRIGLGPSGPQVSEGWYGEPFPKPLARTRTYVETVRRVLDGERTALPLPDGVGFMLDPARPEVLLDPLLNGLAKSGRPREAFDVAAMVPVAIDEDLDAARDSVRPYIAFYLGAMGAKGANFYVDVAERYGIGDAANTIQDAWLAGDQAGAAAAVPDAMLERICLAATPATLGDRLGEFAAAGVDTLIAVPAGDRLRVVRALGAHVSGAGSA
jgi:alkanesulfonate monooxygenase SsuD/methylene tetrahydromethanopterin reductase-like flavin-dependent oxidoreductase (luciferase family)